jgi:hypothetical protein
VAKLGPCFEVISQHRQCAVEACVCSPLPEVQIVFKATSDIVSITITPVTKFIGGTIKLPNRSHRGIKPSLCGGMSKAIFPHYVMGREYMPPRFCLPLPRTYLKMKYVGTAISEPAAVSSLEWLAALPTAVSDVPGIYTPPLWKALLCEHALHIARSSERPLRQAIASARQDSHFSISKEIRASALKALQVLPKELWPLPTFRWEVYAEKRAVTDASDDDDVRCRERLRFEITD